MTRKNSCQKCGYMVPHRVSFFLKFAEDYEGESGVNAKSYKEEKNSGEQCIISLCIFHT